VLADPVRRRVLELLLEHGELPAGAIAGALQAERAISQPAVSQHLRVLRDAGVVRVRTEGARRIYALRPVALQEVDRWLSAFRPTWAPVLDALATEVARGERARRSAAAESTTRTTVARRRTG